MSSLAELFGSEAIVHARFSSRPDSALRSHPHDSPLRSRPRPHATVPPFLRRETIDCFPQQLRVLREAMESGYFDSPRKIYSRELAKKIGIGQSTFLEHLRKAQTNILRQAFKP